ncbi:hypothetical protein QA641_25345 [Bradyrhizobium sp. CB1650]|uniref:hypothetical protein n=1 Tax=Bradyrhizobium sp. CB1650 TaxID=3039153 RepID=UPI002434D6FB|nr:hypothetical protein [Bradyrhizobium sp. CB1650]WGD48964.1 hypothetical protein QA641_25345 [Bradyrhizobium sp. CB1650]
MSRGDELKNLASELSRAAEKARRLGMPTTVYLLSMALVEVSEAAEATDNDDDDDDGAA